MTKPQNNYTNAVESVEQLELPFIVHGNLKWNSHFGRQSGRFLRS